MSKLYQFHRRWRRDTRGSIAVEAALIIPMLTLLFTGAVDFGAAMMARTELFNAVHAGVLYSLVYPDDLAGAIKAVGQASSLETGADAISATATSSCRCKDGSTVSGSCSTASACSASGDDYQIINIVATQNYNLIISFPGLPRSVTLSENATVRTTSH
ncbi:MAG TPA: TadE/TadG family type IV pilus assembly protein [Terriglobia bacterium]|nr:TadE/TadG family type IV pilus assembly protein [Terriglobia bacterium]